MHAHYKKYANEIIECCHRLYTRNMLAGADGNISVCFKDEVLITPSSIQKIKLNPEDFAIVKLDGSIISGRPSSEIQMHLCVYQTSPKAKAVIHAHPPTCIAWSIAKPDLEFLDTNSMSEVILALGKIPIAPFALPGTQSMGDNIRPLIPYYRALILARHGALAWGETLEEAMNGMERMEHVAQILAIAESLGGATSLSSEQLELLRDMRKKIGEKTL